MPRTEATTALAVDRPELTSISTLLLERAGAAPSHVAFARRDSSGALVDVTTSEFLQAVESLARGLIAQGVGVGDRVLVMAPTRYEWALADFAVWAAGGVVVPAYETSAPRQISEIVAESTPVLAIAATADHLARIMSAAPALPTWTMDVGDRDLNALAATGAGVEASAVAARRDGAGLDDLATIVYTSGTTARQKGVRLTHGQIVRLVLNVADAYHEVVNDRAVTIVALPLAHILARALQICAVAVGMTVVHEGDPTRVVATFAEVRPTFMVVVPRVLEKIRAAVRNKAADARLGQVFAAAEATAVEWGTYEEARQDDPRLRPSLSLRVRHALFDKVFYGKLRALLGGRLGWLLSGAAPLDAGLARFFWGVGVPVIEGYGLTETTAPATGGRIGDLRPGSVGTPMPGTTVRVTADGHVEVSGIGVFGGYMDPAQTAEAFTADGFFRTGDIGRLDDAGRLWLHGRTKNLIVTASGKNVAPEPWEALASKSPLVAQAVMVGEGRPYLTALLLVDREAVVRWATRHGRPELAASIAALPATAGGTEITDAALRTRLQRSVDRANAEVSRAEQVRRFAVLLADVTDASDTFTPTLKLRRDALLGAAAEHVTRLYTQGDPS